MIKNFIDPAAEFLFVPADQVMEFARNEGAVPFDAPNVELGHHGDKVSFDAFIEKYKLEKEPALVELSKIIRGADSHRLDLTPQSAGLEAIAEGFRQIVEDDLDNLRRQFHVYDALYAYCRWKLTEEDKRVPAIP